MKTQWVLIALTMILIACTPSYNQQVIPAPIEEIVPDQSSDEEEQIDPPSQQLETGPEDTDIEEQSDEEQSEVSEEVEPANPRLTQQQRERDALGLIDFDSLTAANCRSQEDIWDSAIENTNEDIEEKEDEIEEEIEELERAQNRLDDAKAGGNENLIDRYKDDVNDQEDVVDDVEEELEDLEELLFRTEYTLNEIRDICIGFEQRIQANAAS